MKKRSLFLCTIVVSTFTFSSCLPAVNTPTPVITVSPTPLLITSTPEIHAEFAELQTLKYSLDIKGAEWLLNAAQEGVTFSVTGIYAINNKIAFLFGTFMSAPGDVRSALFRTEDDGRHWLEVMPPLISSEVNHVLFVQDGIGWASVALNAEGLAGTNFWHTSDYGKSWEEIPNVTTGMSEDVLGIMFFDSLHGQRKLFDLTGNPNTDGLVIETTNDGGYTWEESLRVHTPGIMEPQKMIEAYSDGDGGRYGSHWGTCRWTIDNGCQAFGEDGSAWNIIRHKDDGYYILRINELDKSEPLIYKLPLNFKYVDGLFISK